MAYDGNKSAFVFSTASGKEVTITQASIAKVRNLLWNDDEPVNLNIPSESFNTDDKEANKENLNDDVDYFDDTFDDDLYKDFENENPKNCTLIEANRKRLFVSLENASDCSNLDNWKKKKTC